MIFFADNNGTIIKTVPEPVYQGSAGANNIYLVAPFAEGLVVTVRFQLPNGVWTTPALMNKGTADKGAMTGQGVVNGVIQADTEVTYAIWSYSIPNDVTKYYGTVTAQFFFYAAKEGVFTASSSTGFTVGRGVPTVLPDGIEDGTILEQIYYNISSLQSDLKNGYYAARSFYAWNSTYTYGANEIVFYPQTGEFGALLKSLTDGNDAPPYTVGPGGVKMFNSKKWQKVVDFNTLNDLYDLEDTARRSAVAAANSANSAKIFASSASQSADKASQSAAKASQSALDAETTVKEVKEVIPSDATPENPLTTRNFVNSSINNMAAFYITYNAEGNAFPTRASLFNATTYYYGGQPRTPTQNDYAIVLSDESQPLGVDGKYPTTRYSYQGAQWSFQYVVNNTSLTQDQVNAINSGITAQKIADMDEEIDGKVSKTGDTMTGSLTLSNGQQARGYKDLPMNFDWNENFPSGFYGYAFSQHDKCFVCGEGSDKAVIRWDYSNGWFFKVSNGGDVVMNRRLLDTIGRLLDEDGNVVYSPNNLQPPLYSINNIPNGADLNNYITPGVYVSVDSDNKLLNKPSDSGTAGKLVVYTTTNRSSYVNQEWYQVASTNRWVRSSDADGGTREWSAWRYIGGNVYSPNNPPPTKPSIVCLHNIAIAFVISGATYTVWFNHYDNDDTPINTPTKLSNRLFGDLSSGELRIPCSGINEISGSLRIFYRFDIAKHTDQIRFYYYVVNISGTSSGASSFSTAQFAVADTVCVYENNSL